MRAIDVLTNLKNYDCWDFKKYPLSKEEAEVIIKALENNIKVINADDIPIDDEWMQEDKWDEIYKREVENKKAIATNLKAKEIEGGVKITGSLTGIGKRFLEEIRKEDKT